MRGTCGVCLCAVCFLVCCCCRRLLLLLLLLLLQLLLGRCSSSCQGAIACKSILNYLLRDNSISESSVPGLACTVPCPRKLQGATKTSACACLNHGASHAGYMHPS